MELKTRRIAISPNSPRSSIEVLAQSNITVEKVGNYTEPDGNMTTYTLPANTMGANDSLRITTLWSKADATSTTTQAIVRFGGTTVTNGATVLNNTLGTTIETAQHCNVIRANNSLSAQKFYPATDEEFGHETGATMGTGTQDTTTDLIIRFNSVATGIGDVMRLESYCIELLRA